MFPPKNTFVYAYTLPTRFLKALLWLIVLCLVFKCAKISEFLKYFEILVITNSFWAETCPGEKTWIGFLEKWTLCKKHKCAQRNKIISENPVFQPLCFLRLRTFLLAHLGFFRLQGIKVLWGLQFLEYLRTLSLKFQKARTKIEAVLSLSCWLSQLNWNSRQGRLRTISI